MRNYINYYIAALAESKVAFIQNSLKIRSPNSSVGTNPSTVKLLGAILLSRTYVPKFISTICTGHSHSMSIALWKLDASWIYSKGTYKARVSYVLAYQVHNNSGQVLTPFPHPFHPIPVQSQVSILGSIYYHHHIITTSQPYHRSVDRPTPSRHCLKARSPWLRPTLSHGGRREGLISLSSLSETQERSIADQSAHVSIDQPYTLQRFYITTRSAFLVDHRQLD